MLLYGILLANYRKSWKTFDFKLKCRDSYVKFSQKGGVTNKFRHGKGKLPKKSSTTPHPPDPTLPPTGTTGTMGLIKLW